MLIAKYKTDTKWKEGDKAGTHKKNPQKKAPQKFFFFSKK